jgi:uncharacterized protein (TIGR03437 family)
VLRVTVPQSIWIDNVKVRVNIDYPEVGDLNLYLYSPAGTRTKLLERNCGDRGTLRNITFDDAAQSKYSEFCPAESGLTFRGEEPLANSAGENGIGAWRLAVENNGSDDRFGWVLGFSVTINGTVANVPSFTAETVLNAASLRPGPIAPGEMISIFGLGLGPQRPLEAPAGELPTTLGGVSVTIGGVSAVPIKSVSKYRVEVQVPYGIAPGGSAPIVVTNQEAVSQTVDLEVASAAPGVMTVGRAGLGGAVAFNANGTRNTAQSPAEIGSLVKVRAAGLGYTIPTVAAGVPAPTRPAAVFHSVTASIAGLPAEVTEAILEPDAVGTYLVTLRIPTFVQSGPVSVKLSVVGASSQDGALLWVK